MANKIGLNFDGWEEYMAKLDKIGGGSAMKRGAEAGLITSKNHVNPKIKKGVSNGSLPAGGKYSSAPHVKDALDNDLKVNWQGSIAEIKIGFDLKKPGGFTSIYLMYGTPRMKPAKGLKAAIYGATTKKEIAELQSEALNKVIKRIMEG